jgi:hypothetical protein
MKNSKLVFLSSLIVFLLFSCKKSPSNNVNDEDKIKQSDAELLKLYNFSNTSVNGKVTFEVKSTFLGQFTGLNMDFLGRFHTPSSFNEGSTSLNGVQMKVNNDVITSNNVLDYRKSYLLPNSSIVGKNINVSLQAESSSPVLNHQFRIPKLIEFQNFNIQANGIQQLKLNDAVGVKIDAENKMGLMVMITYDPYFLNDSLYAAGYKKEIRNVQIQNDDGAIELDADLFAGIPNRCHYKLEIGRFNYELVTNTDGKKYAFYTLNSLGGYCKNF